MDWRLFTVAIVGDLIWPITALIVLLVLRGPITTLLETISRFKASGFGSNIDVDFGVQASGLVDSAVSLVGEHETGILIDPPVGDVLPDLEDRFKDLTSIVYVAPQGAILEAWKIIEQELSRVAQLHGIGQPAQNRSMFYKENDKRYVRFGVLAQVRGAATRRAPVPSQSSRPSKHQKRIIARKRSLLPGGY